LLMILLIVLHLMVFRRHGVTAPKDAKGEGWFWPDQAFRDMVVSMLIFAVMLGLVLWGHGHKVEPPVPTDPTDVAAAPAEPGLWESWAYAGREGKGANLDAPADMETSSYPARPEWYFLFLFQLLKYFEGEQEIIATVVIPVGVGFLLAILPLLGYGRMRKFGHFVGVVVVVALLGGAATMTYLALQEDYGDTEKAEKLRKELEKADASAARAIQLADRGIPEKGARYLLRGDPMTKGRELFGQHCAACHTYGNEFDVKKPTASDLEGFGTKQWVRGLLNNP